MAASRLDLYVSYDAAFKRFVLSPYWGMYFFRAERARRRQFLGRSVLYSYLKMGCDHTVVGGLWLFWGGAREGTAGVVSLVFSSTSPHYRLNLSCFLWGARGASSPQENWDGAKRRVISTTVVFGEGFLPRYDMRSSVPVPSALCFLFFPAQEAVLHVLFGWSGTRWLG